VDTVQSGKARPGTMQVYDSSGWLPAAGPSPHFTGLFEVLAVAKELGLRVPCDVAILAVEAADCGTVGGPMHPDVQAAIPMAVDWVGRFLERARCATLVPSG
jgi:hydrogenase maturation protease